MPPLGQARHVSKVGRYSVGRRVSFDQFSSRVKAVVLEAFFQRLSEDLAQ
jgi:hypothetical protein